MAMQFVLVSVNIDMNDMELYLPVCSQVIAGSQNDV
jgi:hypothetical protein